MNPVERLLGKLEARWGHCAIPELTMGLIVGQVVLYVLKLLQNQQGLSLEASLILEPQLVLQGQVWRIATFLLVPPFSGHPVLAFFFWYLFYLMGTALEATWGAFRYNVFWFVGTVATVAVSFFHSDALSSNVYLQSSVFLAFAFLFPDFVLHLFFVLPVKIKWLSLLTWFYYLWIFFTGSWQERCLILAATCNFLLFFAHDIRSSFRQGQRHREWRTRQLGVQKMMRHRCQVCGVTNLTDPKMQFRYCSACDGQIGYCPEHIHNHEHVRTEAEPEQVS